MDRKAFAQVEDILRANATTVLYKVHEKKPNRKLYKLRNIDSDNITGWYTHNQLKHFYTNLGKMGRLLYG